MQENYFTVQPSKINKNNFSLSTKESNHFLKSLRGKIDDEIWLLNGIGTAYHACVKSIDDNYVTGTIINSFSNYGESNFNINLIIGLIKGHRMDMVFEKATELGVKSIQPLIFDHCIKNKLNLKRAERIIISAAKQTGRSFFPKIHDPTNLETWLLEHHKGFSFVCHINGKKSISNLVANNEIEINIIIGPEGDFSKQELNQFEDAKIKLVNLSSRRLRSESAAIVSIANVIQIME